MYRCGSERLVVVAQTLWLTDDLPSGGFYGIRAYVHSGAGYRELTDRWRREDDAQVQCDLPYM